MQTINWYFDFISPFAYFQWAQLSDLPEKVTVRYKPILFAGLLNHWGQKGPAEIPAKRQFTYRHTTWLAGKLNLPFKFPPAHPFNPLKVLRLALALACRESAIQTIFEFIWRDGNPASDTRDIEPLANQLGVSEFNELISKPAVKEQLKNNTNEAIEAGIFGVPTLVANKEIFWGFDATDMLLDYLKNPGLFEHPEMQRVSNLPESAQRKIQ